MIQVDADILLIDEVLAVGDAAFQQKCFDEFDRIRDDGQDDPARHARHGRGAALLRPRDAARARPRSSTIGDPHDVGNRYLELNFVRGRARRRRAGEPTERARATARARDRRGVVRGRARRARDDAPVGPAVHASPRACASASRSRTRCSASCSRTTRRDTVFARLDAVRRPGSRARFAAGEEVDVPRRVRQPARARPLPRDARGRARRAAAIAWIDRRERIASVLVTGSRAPTAIVDLAVRRSTSSARADRDEVAAMSADATVAPPGRRDQGPDRARRRPAPALAPHADARGHRLQAALLRLGARLPVAADAAAAAVRRPLRRLHAGRAARRRRRATTRSRCCSASCSSRSSPRPPAARVTRSSTARRWSARSSSRGSAIPLAAVLTALFNLGAEPGRGARLPARRRRRAALSLARAAVPARRAARAVRDRARRCCSRRCSCATATSSRSGTSCCRCMFYATPIFYPIDVVIEQDQTLATLLMCNPFAAILQQSRHALIDPSHPSAAEAIGGPALLLIPLAISSRSSSPASAFQPRGAADRRGAVASRARCRTRAGRAAGRAQPRVDARGAEALGLRRPRTRTRW